MFYIKLSNNYSTTRNIIFVQNNYELFFIYYIKIKNSTSQFIFVGIEYFFDLFQNHKTY